MTLSPASHRVEPCIHLSLYIILPEWNRTVNTSLALDAVIFYKLGTTTREPSRMYGKVCVYLLGSEAFGHQMRILRVPPVTSIIYLIRLFHPPAHE